MAPAFFASAMAFTALAAVQPSPVHQSIPIGSYKNVGAGAAHDGTWVRQLDATSGGVEKALSLTIPIVPNAIARLEAWCNEVTSTTAPGLRLQWLDATGTVLQTATAVCSTVGSWSLVMTFGRAPAGAVKMVASIYSPTTTNAYFDGITLVQFPPAGPVGGFWSWDFSAPDFIDCARADHFELIDSTGLGYTVPAPLNPYVGQEICVKVKNTSGGAGVAITWNAIYKMAAFTNPGGTASKSVTFKYSGTNWIEVSRTPNDVPN